MNKASKRGKKNHLVHTQNGGAVHSTKRNQRGNDAHTAQLVSSILEDEVRNGGIERKGSRVSDPLFGCDPVTGATTAGSVRAAHDT